MCEHSNYRRAWHFQFAQNAIICRDSPKLPRFRIPGSIPGDPWVSGNQKSDSAHLSLRCASGFADVKTAGSRHLRYLKAFFGSRDSLTTGKRMSSCSGDWRQLGRTENRAWEDMIDGARPPLLDQKDGHLSLPPVISAQPKFPIRLPP